MDIPVAYEDDWILVANKPAGLLTIPTPKNETRTLTNILNSQLQEKGVQYHLHPCHRLDRETSGLIIYAKGKSIQKKIMDIFKMRKVSKKYLAFVQGALEPAEGTIRIPIEGRSAVTEYQVSLRKKDFSVVKIFPLTGRKNQIRIHFKAIGHPLVGETRFAFRKDYALKAKRLCLHAESLAFKHPVSAKELKLFAPLAQDLEYFLKQHP
jgi:RluA family pseudouridine synthase